MHSPRRDGQQGRQPARSPDAGREGRRAATSADGPHMAQPVPPCDPRDEQPGLRRGSGEKRGEAVPAGREARISAPACKLSAPFPRGHRKMGRSRFTFMGEGPAWPTVFSPAPLRRGFPAQLSPKSVGIGSQAGGLRPEAGWGPAPGTQVRESPPRDVMGLAGARKPPARPCLGRSEIRVPEGSGQRAPTHPALCAQGPEKPVLGVGAWACHSRVVTLWPCRSNCPLI